MDSLRWSSVGPERLVSLSVLSPAGVSWCHQGGSSPVLRFCFTLLF
uniref:Uncharacterized protein n=1 Tax=Anguilla anguilla TaxID=7936 RepID=A0A0E9XQ77_ANGAN